ncbi:hypothetical protein ACQ4PT_016771 [Festuca glaucescens]
MAGLQCERPSKRKAEESFAAGEEPSRSAKRMDCSEGSERARGEAAAAPVKKKMWRLPKEGGRADPGPGERAGLRCVPDLKRANPSLVMSPEEEKDERTVRLYRCTRDAYEGEERRAETTRLCKEAREKVFRGRDRESDSVDDDL